MHWCYRPRSSAFILFHLIHFAQKINFNFQKLLILTCTSLPLPYLLEFQYNKLFFCVIPFQVVWSKLYSVTLSLVGTVTFTFVSYITPHFLIPISNQISILKLWTVFTKELTCILSLPYSIRSSMIRRCPIVWSFPLGVSFGCFGWIIQIHFHKYKSKSYRAENKI